MYLFSYGSNSPRQLAERLERSVTGSPAVLEGYIRVFRGTSQRWGGGVASLNEARNGETYGWIAKVKESDLKKLDRFEGVASGKYERVKLQVIDADADKLVDAVAYVSTSSTFNAPSREYLEAVAETVGSFWEGDGGKVSWRDFPVR